MQPKSRILSSLAAFSLVFAVSADAQVRYGSIVVDVTDQSGGAVPGADIAFRIESTQVPVTGGALDGRSPGT